MITKFSEWVKMREDAAAGAPAAPAPAPSSPSTPPSDPSPPPSDNHSGGTTTGDVAHVPFRLAGCGFCYPNCSCGSCKKKRRKKRKKRGKK